MRDTAELLSALVPFTGTERWHRHGLNRHMLYTDGVQYFAEHAGGGAYWFLDIVATEIFGMQKQHSFMAVKLVSESNKPTVIVEDGNDNVLYTRADIEYTDCPEGIWKFYLIDNVLLLPSEY